MIVEIDINSPVLVAGQYFQVRYREVGSPTWIPIANQTNAPFTINLDPGEYQFEFVLVKGSPPVACPPVYRLFVVNGEAECPEVSAVITRHTVGDSGAPQKVYYTLDITYTAGDACSYILEYGPTGGTQQQVPYTTLPASPFSIPIPTNVPYTLVLKACNCERVCKVCYEEEVPPADEPDCTPGTYTAEGVYYSDRRNPDWFPGGRLRVTIVTPPTILQNPFTVSYTQVDISGGNGQGLGDSGLKVFNLIPGQTVYDITPINPNVTYCGPIIGISRAMRYTVVITDACGNTVLQGQNNGVYWYA